MKQFTAFLGQVDNFVWGVPLIVLILSAGVYLTFRLRLIQVIHLPKALRFMVKTKRKVKVKLQALGHCVQHFQQLLEQEIS